MKGMKLHEGAELGAASGGTRDWREGANKHRLMQKRPLR